MLFSGVRYAISPTLPAQRQNELARLLDANGATMVEFPEATHIISNTIQFEGRETAMKVVQIITDEWVDRSIVQGKLQETKYFSADPIMIFSGVVACVADLEPCDTEVIAAGINALGGLFREGYTRDCTHVLAARPDSDKYLTAMHYASATRVKVVLPHWFDDCFKLLVRIPEDTYAWPDPPLLRTNYALNKARLSPSKKALVKAAVLEDEPAEKIATLGRPESNIWLGKRVLLSSTLKLAEGRREAVEAAIQRAGGLIVQLSGNEAADVDSADVYVTFHRFGRAFVKAMRAKKTVATLAWLFHVHKTGIITPPQDQLLHFPSPPVPLPGFDKHKITATNYEGDARRYLKKLIELMGGEFTPQMTVQNTVVVAAFIKGEKATKAREWNIPVVNHTWLEDCFATWTLVTPAQEKYVSFPPGVNFGELVSTRGLPPLSEGDLVEIERASDVVEMEKETGASEEQLEVGVVKEVERAPEKSPRTRSSQKSSTSNSGKNRRDGQNSPLKPAAARLNAQPGEKREEEEEEEEDSQPPRGRGRAMKRRRESDKESDAETPSRRGRLHASPTKRVTRSRAREDEESEDEDDGALRRPGRTATTSRKSSPTKTETKTKIVHIDDDTEEDVPPRRMSNSKKAASTKGRSPKEITVSSSPKSKANHLKSRLALALLNDEEFASSSDDGLSPIKSSKKSPVHQSTSKSKSGKPSKSRVKHVEEEEEEDEEEEVEVEVAPKKPAHTRKNAIPGPSKPAPAVVQNHTTPIRKQGSLPGPTPGKTVFVEIPSPRKSSTLTRTRSAITAAPDGAAVHASPKRGRPAPRTQSRGLENESPLSSPGSPAESPSRSSRFSDDAVRRSSQPTPIISTAHLLRTPSKRQAASKASAKLHEDALDIIKFEKEKRSGRFRGGWEDGTERISSKAEPRHEENRKRRSSAVEPASDMEEPDSKSKKRRKSDTVENGTKSSDAHKKGKKPRVSKSISADEGEEVQRADSDSEEDLLDGSDIRLMTTQVSLSEQVLKGLRQLGVTMASKPTECNLLLANSIGRTEKFLCAMATAQSIVKESWAIDSVKAKRILPFENYFLKDPEGEKKHKFKLSDALRRAQSSDRKLLEGHTFYFTKGLLRSEKITTYKNVISSAGGKYMSTNPTVRILKGHEDRHVLSVEGDSSLVEPLIEEGLHVYLPEFLLVGVLLQKMDWDNTPHRLDRN